MQGSYRRLATPSRSASMHPHPSPSTTSRLPRTTSSASIAQPLVVPAPGSPSPPRPSRAPPSSRSSSVVMGSPNDVHNMHLNPQSRAELQTIAESLLASVRFPNTHSFLSQSPARSPLSFGAPIPLPQLPLPLSPNATKHFSTSAHVQSQLQHHHNQPLSAARHFEGKEHERIAARSRSMSTDAAMALSTNTSPGADRRGRDKAVKGLASKKKQPQS